MSIFMNPQEYSARLCKRELKSESNKIGVLLLLFFGAQQFLAWAAVKLIKATSTEDYFRGSATMELLLNGVLSTVIFFLICVIYCSIRRLSYARLFPFGRIGGRRTVALCVVGLAFSLMSNVASNTLTEVFALFGITNRGGAIVGSSGPPSVPIYYITVAVLPALAEEFAFRGVVMGSLRRYSDALALLVSSAAFALMHGNFVQMPFTFCCGLVFGYIAIKTNSLLPAILIHFLNNAISVTTDVLIMYRVVSVTVCNIIFNSAVIVLGVIALFILRRMIRQDPEMFRMDNGDTRLPYRDKMKTTASSPTIIIFAVIMMLYSVYILFMPYL